MIEKMKRGRLQKLIAQQVSELQLKEIAGSEKEI